LIRDDIPQHVGILSAHELRHRVSAKDWNKGKQYRCKKAAFYVGQKNQDYRSELTGPQIPCGFQKRKIKFVDGREQGKYRVRQIHIDQHEGNRLLVVHKGNVLRNQIKAHKKFIYKTVVP